MSNQITPNPSVPSQVVAEVKFPRFINNLGIIPTSYKDSMSYYECLAWLCKYLEETVIPTVNENGLATEELQNLYIQLNGYVANYFDNLDVQEEINNKLDDMVEQGTLQEIIADYLNAKAVFGFDNVADMKNSTNLINGSYARTLGYHEKNDRGSALYKIRTITNDDVVDEMFIIAMNDLENQLIAELIITDSINPEQVGCYGDGIHDDTTIFTNLVEYLENKNYILTGIGTYLLTDEIEIENINIEMPNATIISEYGIKITATNKNLNLPKITSNLEITDNIAGITLFECYQNNVTINLIDGFYTGLLLASNEQGCVYNTINILEIRNCLHSLVLEHQSNNGWVNENLFIGGRLWHDSTYTTNHGADIIKISLIGTETHSCNNNLFLHCSVEGEEGTANGLKIKLSHTMQNKFEMCRYDGTNPKVYAEYSDYDVINDGFNSNNITFTNDPVTVNFYDTTSKIVKAGKRGGYYKDITVSSNSYPIFNLRNVLDQTTFKIMNDGFETVAASNGKTQLKVNTSGINGFDNNDTMFTMIRSYGGHNLMCNADGTNHCFVISPGANITNACFLWIYDNHLYGKMGSKPSTQTDGTIIL